MKAVAILSFFTNNIEDRVDKLSAFGIVAFGPVITSTGLSKDEVIRPEDLAIRPTPQAIHGSWLEVHEYSSRNVSPTASFVEVHIDALELALRVFCAAVGACGIDAMLAADKLPELGADLVAALAGLDVQDLTHCSRSEGETKKEKEDCVEESSDGDGGGGGETLKGQAQGSRNPNILQEAKTLIGLSLMMGFF